MTYSKERIKFLNQPVYSILVLLHCGVGIDWAGPFYPPSKMYRSFYLSVFWIMLLFHCILTLMNDLFQRENQVFKPTGLLVLLHCGVGKDWVDPFFLPPPLPPPPNVLTFLFIFQSFGLYFYFTVS